MCLLLCTFSKRRSNACVLTATPATSAASSADVLFILDIPSIHAAVTQAVTNTSTAVETPSTDAKDASLQQTADVQEAQQQPAEMPEAQQQPSNKKVRLGSAAQHAVIVCYYISVIMGFRMHGHHALNGKPLVRQTLGAFWALFCPV